MRIFLIGHRGTGKTSLLQRLQIYGRGGFPVFDLDREIEKRKEKSISEIFATEGEAQFRVYETEILEKLIKANPNMVCALGAGFRLDSFALPPSSEILWVRRASDAAGRIFLNRPRLESNLAPLDEFRERYQKRDELYAQHADWSYWIPEGLTSPCEFERQILGDRLQEIGGTLTLTPMHFRNPSVFRNRIAKMGVDFFELRSDLLNSVELEMALAQLPSAKLLVSIRHAQVPEDWRQASELAAQVDWACELGLHPGVRPTSYSLHEHSDGETDLEVVSRLRVYEDQGMHVKWSPFAKSFAEIDFGLRWQNEKPGQRSYLPRSLGGRWNWVRLLLKDRQKFNFIRDGAGSAPDQPTLHEWLRAASRPNAFGAVLGSPVLFSYSPIEHLAYAQEKNMSFFAIDLPEAEWAEAIPVLRNWGLKVAAVTSPLKQKAYELAQEKSPAALELHTANTLTFKNDGKVHADNTDLGGFREFIEDSPETGATVIWGGGGTLPVLRKVLPEAQAVSVRTGLPRDPVETLMESPDTVVWAAGADAELPPLRWKPKQILDLNYRDDSRAKEYAERVGARYIAGLTMFRAQAALQRQEWESHVE